MIPFIAAAGAIGKVATAVTSLAKGLSRSGTSHDVKDADQASSQKSFESLVASHGAAGSATPGAPLSVPSQSHPHGHGKAGRAIDRIA
jgi:hypothetical protein